MSESEKACTDSMTPDRVRNVPRMVRLNVAIDERQVPHPQQAAALLDEHRVQIGGGAQPREERRVLHRVPGPEAAPPEHLVRPPRSEHDARRSETPTRTTSTAGWRAATPRRSARHERGDGEGEGDGEADEAEVEQGRVEGHQRVVLQQDVGAEAVGGHGADHGLEGIGGPAMRPKKKAATTRVTSVAQATSGSSACAGTATPSPRCSRPGSAPTAGSTPPAPTTCR